MKVFVVIAILVLATTTGCLIRPTSSPQELRHVSGSDLSELQLRKQLRLKKKSAVKILDSNGCKALFKKNSAHWRGTDTGNMFVAYRLEKKGFWGKGVSCNEQFMSIDLQAVFFMAQHNIRCSLDRRNLLQLHIPNDNGEDKIKVDCRTRLIDLNFYNNALRVGTFEDDGSAHLATVDQQGNLSSATTRVIEGISPEKLAEIKKRLDATISSHNYTGEPLKDMLEGGVDDDSILNNLNQQPATYIIGGTTTSIAGLVGIVISSNIATSAAVTASAAAVATGASLALALFVVPVGIGVAVGMIGLTFVKAKQEYETVVPMMRTLIHLRLNGSKTFEVYEKPQEHLPNPRPT